MKRVEALMPFAKYSDLSSSLDENPIPRNNAVLNLACYKSLRDARADDFGFAPADKSDCGDSASKMTFTLRGDQKPTVERTTEQLRTDNLSTCAARDAESSSVALRTSVGDQEQSRITERTLRTPAIVSKPSSPSFATLQTSNLETQENARDAAQPSPTIFTEMGIWMFEITTNFVSKCHVICIVI